MGTGRAVMTEPKTYQITTLSSMFAVPIEKRAVMFRELELSMSLSELALGDKAADSMKSIEWVDDGDSHVTLSINGEDALKPEVTKGQP
jgi:hypothetical protein